MQDAVGCFEKYPVAFEGLIGLGLGERVDRVENLGKKITKQHIELTCFDLSFAAA